jgi:HEAT repeat protein
MTFKKGNEMLHKTNAIIGLLVVGLLLVAAVPMAVADEAVDKAFETAFETLKTYDWAADRGLLKPIDDAVAKSYGKPDQQKELSAKLSAVLGTDAKDAGKDYVCRKLSLIGSAANVPAISPLLTNETLSHMARYALERIPAPEAVAAMRDALPKVSGILKQGVINSLGVRRDAQSTTALVALLADKDTGVAGAAVAALGNIGTPEAAKALGAFQAKAPKELTIIAADAYLTCAERLLADGKKMGAMMIYKALSKSKTKNVRLAAIRGLLAAAGKKKK